MLAKVTKSLFERAPIGAKVILPILLSSLLLLVLTKIVYYGGKRESLAALAEGYLVRIAVRWAQEDARQTGEVVIVSAKDSDYEQFPHANNKAQLRDLSVNSYAEILARVNTWRPRMIVLSWLGGAHPFDADYLRPITDTIDRLGLNDKVYLALPFTLTGPVPQELRRYHFRDADDCVYEVNSFCSYVKEWDWVIQALVDKLWPNPPPYHITRNLPHALPNFIANLPREASIPVFSFHDVMQGHAKVKEGAVVLVGNDIHQDPQFRDNKYVLQRTFSAGSPRMHNLIDDGSPFHAYWAQLAQMFIDGNTVAVPPVTLSRVITGVMCLFLLLVIIRFKLAAGFGTLVFYALLMPLMNVPAVRYLNVYIPAFDVLYAGLIVFIAAAFITLSNNAFQRWRLESRQKSLEESADLKSNFISLISHNLNTPVAKLRGLIDILLASDTSPTRAGYLKHASVQVAKLQLCTRSVLMSTSLEVKAMSPMTINVKTLLDEFENSAILSIQRLGYRVKFRFDSDEARDETLYEMFVMDPKVVAMAMASMVALVRSTGEEREIPLHLQLTDKADGLQLIVRLYLAPTKDRQAPFLIRTADEGLQRGIPNTDGDTFFASSLANFLTLATKAHHGSLHIETKDQGLEMVSYWGSVRGGQETV